MSGATLSEMPGAPVSTAKLNLNHVVALSSLERVREREKKLWKVCDLIVTFREEECSVIPSGYYTASCKHVTLQVSTVLPKEGEIGRAHV